MTPRTVFQTSIRATRRDEYGFTAGGLIIKNQTFIFGSLFRLSTSTASTSVAECASDRFQQPDGSGLTGQLRAVQLGLWIVS